ncbi:branched-chain amino acid ABC transporter permease [Jonquetella anthropi]|uniref:branched-chain amino acid ABC transporter permease n=1 Tax=Jonquetella anthropi TaxID=428712 RepID=UPI0001B9146C|nr:branched-chain amino acid ABC transporter permease [Jonquetella anthropi]EEX47872.1 branched-chain amino acid ABC transporter, permease protein [Jonquetella anthropi E3_33 E1]
MNKQRSTGKFAALLLILAVYLVVIPLVFRGHPYFLGVLTQASVLSVISAGVWLMFYIGRINIGQGAFALIGGYTAAILMKKIGLSFWLASLGAVAVTVAAAVIVGLPLLRLKGVYFSMITLCLTETARLAAQSFPSLTNGAKGILNIPMPGAVKLGDLTLIPDFASVDKHLAYYYLGAVLLLFCFAVLYRVVHSRLGWLLRSLQENEDLASSFGVDVPRLRVIAFGICAVFAGLGGSFFVTLQQCVYPATFTVQDSTYFLLYCFLGGLGSVWGALAGTFVLFLSFEALQGLNQYQPLIYSLIMIGMMLWLPNGLLSLRLPWFRKKLVCVVPVDERPDAKETSDQEVRS